MDGTDESADIDILVETEIVDIDGDGVVDVVSETTTTVIDVDGDGVADIVQTTTTTAYDLDGDGEPDLIESTTITGIDVDGDGEFSEDEIEVDETIAMTDELAEELERADDAE